MLHRRSRKLGKINGFSLTEIMMTLLITALVLTLGLMTILGYLSKRELSKNISLVKEYLEKAEDEAIRKGEWSCVTFQGNPIAISIYFDVNDDRICGNNTDTLYRQITLPREIVFATSCSNRIVTNGGAIFFSGGGLPTACASSGAICSDSDLTPSSCVPCNFQIILSHTKLPSQARAKELELLENGVIYAPVTGDKGQLTSRWALAPNINATGACE